MPCKSMIDEAFLFLGYSRGHSCFKKQTQDNGPTYMTRGKAARFLQVTLPTLHAWTQRGKPRASKIDESSRA